MKTLNRSAVYVQWEWQKYIPPSPPLYKDKRLREMSTGNLILVFNSVTVSYLIHYDSLLQSATDIITKCDSYYKMRRLLQIATVQIYLEQCEKILNIIPCSFSKNQYWW